MPYAVEIPYGCYWSTPFVRWQGSFSHLHALEFAAHVARQELSRRDIPATVFDHAVLGMSVPQKHSFFGTPWLASLLGSPELTGQIVSQACATGVRALLTAAQEIGSDLSQVALAMTCDRTSNGPHLYYPNPAGPGGTGGAEDWVMDNFGYDPVTTKSMLTTAENVAREFGLDMARQHDLVLQRQDQYAAALANDSAFLRRFMTLPFEVPTANFKKLLKTLPGDEGIVQSTAEGLAKLKPVMPEGTVTFGSQTHPADGNAAIIVATPTRARELSKDPGIAIRLLGFGQARVKPGFMPMAPAPAARKALAQAGLDVTRIDAFKLHNPFAANDFAFALEMGIDVGSLNNYGCSLLWGHPQAPMGTRGIIEVIEELALRGGGYGLFSGCAAGDSAMAVVLKVGDPD